MRSQALGRPKAPPPRRAVTVYLGLGSNVGDRVQHLRLALGRLGDLGSVLAVSSLYETSFIGLCNNPQPMYLNGVVELSTDLRPLELLYAVVGIEALGGRRPTDGWRPRTIDIDVLLYGDVTMQTGVLTIPHPRMWARAFVLRPLAELAPLMETPDGISIRQAASELETQGQQVVKAHDPGWWDGPSDNAPTRPRLADLRDAKKGERSEFRPGS